MALIYESKKILIAPLNWGLGHASRCIPIINSLADEGFHPVLAGDGDSLKLLQKEFPQLKYYELPSYNIKYTKRGGSLKYRLIFDSPKIKKAIRSEQEELERIIDQENIAGIISDNRFGVRSNRVKSVYLTHQINVLSGITSLISSKIHQIIISKFDECWVPDYKEPPGLAGKLSHTERTDLRIKYIQPISRFNYQKITKKNDLLVLLSGPEPQRSILENKILTELIGSDKTIILVRGLISEKQEILNEKNLTSYNFMLHGELQDTINESALVIARSGYSSIMDLERLNAKAFFIPTPGQFEQEYLAKHLEQHNIAPYSGQDKFSLKMLKEIKDYSGFKSKWNSNEFGSLFDIFRKEP